MFPEPVCKVLVNQKICSSRGARTLFKQGRVTVNGKVVEQHDFAVDVAKDDISVDGKLLEKVQHVYLVLNKPVGYVCSAVSDSHRVVYQLLEKVHVPALAGSLHTAGRLDCETGGLIVVTTNGSFSHLLVSPEFKVTKTYLAVLREPVTEEMQSEYKNLFRAGVVMPADKKAAAARALPAEIDFVSPDQCLIRVQEGQFHQVRRMVQGAGNFVEQLTRVGMGPLSLEGLEPGQFRNLTEEELKKFKNL